MIFSTNYPSMWFIARGLVYLAWLITPDPHTQTPRMVLITELQKLWGMDEQNWNDKETKPQVDWRFRPSCLGKLVNISQGSLKSSNESD